MATPGSWSAVGEQATEGAWRVLELAGPAVLAALIVFFLIRAVTRQHRYRVVTTFDSEDRKAVRRAIADAERKTVGEILPVIVERSDPHPGAEWLAALTCTVVGSSLLAPWLPWEHPVWVLLAQFAMGFIAFTQARWFPGFKRLFIFEDRASEVAHEQAFQEFYANGLHKTEAATGVLIFVSLLEHRVILLADEGIDSRVDAAFWATIDDRILEGIRAGSLRKGLITGIELAGERLATEFPWAEGDRNEIPDRIIVREA